MSAARDGGDHAGWAVRGCGVALIAVILTVVGWCTYLQIWVSFGHISDGTVRAWIEREAPVGSTEAQVRRFFGKHDIPFSGPESPKIISDPDVDSDYPGKMMLGMIRQPRSLGAGSGIHVVFYMNSRGRVARYDVKSWDQFL